MAANISSWPVVADMDFSVSFHPVVEVGITTAHQMGVGPNKLCIVARNKLGANVAEVEVVHLFKPPRNRIGKIRRGAEMVRLVDRYSYILTNLKTMNMARAVVVVRARFCPPLGVPS